MDPKIQTSLDALIKAATDLQGLMGQETASRVMARKNPPKLPGLPEAPAEEDDSAALDAMAGEEGGEGMKDCPTCGEMMAGGKCPKCG